MSSINPLQLGPITSFEVIEYNEQIQRVKSPENQQRSFEKYHIKEWEVVEMSGEDILSLQSFVETSGVVGPAYWLWKVCGKNTTVGSVAQYVKEHRDDMPDSVKPWIGYLFDDQIKAIDQKIENNEIHPPLLVFPVFNDKEIRNFGMLNLGNILDGNMRLMEVSSWLLDQDENTISNFKLKVVVGHIDMFMYFLFNAYYLFEPFRDQILNSYAEKNISPENVMSFSDRLALLKQRLGKR